MCLFSNRWDEQIFIGIGFVWTGTDKHEESTDRSTINDCTFYGDSWADFVKGDETFAGEAELGATLTTGNTETSSFKGR